MFFPRSCVLLPPPLHLPALLTKGAVSLLGSTSTVHFPNFVPPDLGLLGEIGSGKKTFQSQLKVYSWNSVSPLGNLGSAWSRVHPEGTKWLHGQGRSLPQNTPLIPSHAGSWSGSAMGPSPFSIALGSGFYRGKKISWDQPKDLSARDTLAPSSSGMHTSQRSQPNGWRVSFVPFIMMCLIWA